MEHLGLFLQWLWNVFCHGVVWAWNSVDFWRWLYLGTVALLLSLYAYMCWVTTPFMKLGFDFLGAVLGVDNTSDRPKRS